MQKNYVIFSKCDNVIENHSITHAMTSLFLFLIFDYLYIYINMKTKYSMTFFWTKMSLDFQNNENHVVAFSLLVLVW
jgi:hypothetical protein